MLASAMPENPTYRVTGDDWDPREPDPDGPFAATPADPAMPLAASLDDAGESIEVEPTADAATEVEPIEFQAVADENTALRAAAVTPDPPPALRPMPTLPPALQRFEPILERLWPRVAEVPPRVLAAGAGAVVVIGVALVVVLGSGRPSAAVTNASPEPTRFVAPPTPTCPALTELPPPVLVVESGGREVGRLAGFSPPDSIVNLDGPWPTELGPVEATVALGSSFRLTADGACIREWRAVAVKPPIKMGKTWRPKRSDRLPLGWQKADRIGWEPTVSLPPRGEWVLRVTVWYRVPPAPSPEPSAATAAPAGELVVERYFRVAVQAPS